MSVACSVILTTAGSRAEAEKLSTLLVERRLAACIQIVNVDSTYRWQGKVTSEPEFLLLIKTVSRRYKEVQAAILEYHSYEVPETIQIPITRGSERYLDWIVENIK